MNDLALPEELKKEVTTMEEMTRTVAVKSPQERADVYRFVQLVKAKKKAIVDYFAEMKEAAHSAWKKVVATEKAETDKLDAFEAAAKRAILKFDQEEEAKREAERRRLQAIADEQARKERERAEQEAAKQRAIEDESRRKADEARKAAEAANAEERARLLREAEAAERKAAAANSKAEQKAELAAAVVAPVVEIARTADKQHGESTTKIWKFVVTDATKIPREWLIVDEKALGVFVRATKGAKEIPGVKIYSKTSLKIGSR